MRRTPALVFFLALTLRASATEAFIEAESFTSDGGWTKVEGGVAKASSGIAMLGGASGKADGVATTTVQIKDAGDYHVWVRYHSNPKWRGPFHVTALAGGRVVGDSLFDESYKGQGAGDTLTWQKFEVNLPEGDITLQLSKHENNNAPGPVRLVDCLLLTMDDKLLPNHSNYGAQTFVRVKLGEGYTRPVYFHVFADHYRAPWYAHWSLGKSGAVESIQVKNPDMLLSGESTPWCNLTPTIYQDSGAMLNITARHGYADYAERLRATLEFATAPDEKAVVRRLEIDNKPGTISIYAPPNLLTPENVVLLKTDREIAEATGKLADAHPWPAHGKKPERFPFFVSARVNNTFTPSDERVRAREQKTLDYFGFTDSHLHHIGGIGSTWLMKDKSYCNPDIDKMRVAFKRDAEAFRKKGGKVGDIVFCDLMDEPSGQSLDFAAKEPSYVEPFRAWLRQLGKTPADLFVKDWSDVKIVTVDQRKDFPALYLYSQRFRTRALGDFMAVQRKLAEEAYGGTFPVVANFSDGAVYGANFCVQGVDYFELLDSPDQNAIWGEDWANSASSFQCAAFNVDLMRAAASERGQIIAHHLVAHSGRKGWDIKLKATSEAARGVKIFNNFAYGPTWATHEGGPYWRSHVWQGKPETWTANASITREIGAVEDMLVKAMPAPAKVALLYSSSSDAWTVGETFAHGFDRMHTWMALAHSQMPVDVVAERQVERGLLEGYEVCYLSGPNLTRAAAEKLRSWVQSGGTLWLAAGAAMRDEFDRPMDVLDDILPAKRGETHSLQPFQNSGRYLTLLTPKDEARWEGGSAPVLAIKQPMTANAGCKTVATFKDGSAATVSGTAGKGNVICCGFLPSLGYIKAALDHRDALKKKIDGKAALTAEEQHEAAMIERSYNPWKFPADIRNFILGPTRAAKIVPPIHCSHALVDAVFMPQEGGILIPLANYTLEPIDSLTLQVTVPRKVVKVESAVRGDIAFKQTSPTSVELSLPLDNNDFLTLRFE